MGTVQCRDCGYLSRRDQSNGKLAEVEESERKTGQTRVYGGHQGGRIEYAHECSCFVRSYDLEKEFAKECEPMVGDNDRLKQKWGAFLTVIDRCRDCEKFTLWQRGFSPKEHFEMDRIEKEKQWREDRLQDDRKWRQEESGKADERYKKDSADAERRHGTEIAVLGEKMISAMWKSAISAAIIGSLFAALPSIIEFLKDERSQSTIPAQSPQIMKPAQATPQSTKPDP